MKTMKKHLIKGAAPDHKYKSFALKADEDSGTISGYFSTYDRIPDSYGDVIEKSAFDETIQARKKSGHPFPLCWNHNLDQIIGLCGPGGHRPRGRSRSAHEERALLRQRSRSGEA